jgi:hypothetical protein
VDVSYEELRMGPCGPDIDPVDMDRHVGIHTYSAGCDGPPICTVPLEQPEAEPAPRASMLREAETLICGDRNNQYGPPTQDFQRTADLLNALGYKRLDAEDVIHDILPSDVALIIAQVKVSRIIHSRHKRDSWVDLAGYAACGYECAEEEAKPGAS